MCHWFPLPKKAREKNQRARESDLYSFSWFWLSWPQNILAKTDSVHENAVFPLPNKNSVWQFFAKDPFSNYLSCQPLKTLFFSGHFVSQFSFVCLFHLFCLSFSNIKTAKQKCDFLFESIISDITLLEFGWGGELGPSFITTLGPVFDTKKNLNIGPVFNSTVHMYVYV